MDSFKLLKTILFSIGVCIFTSASCVYAQSNTRQEIQALVKQEGEIFIVVNYPKVGQEKPCVEENLLSNQISFKQDSAFINYINYTELFCEVYVLRTHYTYHFSLKDMDITTMRLVEKKYEYGNGRLEEGPETWFEIQLFTKDNKPLIKKKDVENKQTESIETVNLIFKSKQGAQEALGLFRSEFKQHMF